MNVLVVFDVKPKEQTESFRKKLQGFGYFVGWYMGDEKKGSSIFLPDNSVWKKDGELDEVKKQVIEAVEEMNKTNPENKIRLEHLIVVPSSPWAALETKYNDGASDSDSGA